MLEKHSIQTELYELEAFYQSKTLSICLKTHLENELTTFFKTIKDHDLPTEIKSHLEKTQYIFECLKTPEIHEVDPLEGKIIFKTYFNFGKKIMEKKSIIELKKAFSTTQALQNQVFFLRKEIQCLKLVKNQKAQEKDQQWKNQIIEEIKSLKVQQEDKFQELKKQNNEKDDQIFVMTQFIEKLNKKIQLLEKGSDSNKESEVNCKIQKIPMNKQFDFGTRFSKRFKGEGNTLTYKGEDARRTQFFFNKQIGEKSMSVSWKVNKTFNSSIIFGLTDKSQTLRNRTSVDSAHSICYYGLNGMVWNQKSQSMFDGRGVKEGETITMRVQEGKILWSVDSEIRGSVSTDFMKQRGRNLVPYVQLSHKNDEIEWLG